MQCHFSAAVCGAIPPDCIDWQQSWLVGHGNKEPHTKPDIKAYKYWSRACMGVVMAWHGMGCDGRQTKVQQLKGRQAFMARSKNACCSICRITQLLFPWMGRANAMKDVINRIEASSNAQAQRSKGISTLPARDSSLGLGPHHTN